jgi:prephenate dehydrogenase
VTEPRPAAIAFLGLGLIGGSIARALRGKDDHGRPAEPIRIAAWTPDGRGPALALRQGVIDAAAASPAEALPGAGLVVIAAPPLATIELLGRLGTDLRAALPETAVVTDVASTKGAVMRAAATAGIRFVGGHPMAGREIAGYEASDPDLFRDRPWVVVAPAAADGEATEMVRWLATACGARPLELDAATHDSAVAAISHLPLIASAALVEAVARADDSDWRLQRSLAASGWDGMTRLARGDARMGAGIAATNADALAAMLGRYRDVIEDWILALEADERDAAALELRLEAARARLLETDDT